MLVVSSLGPGLDMVQGVCQDAIGGWIFCSVDSKCVVGGRSDGVEWGECI